MPLDYAVTVRVLVAPVEARTSPITTRSYCRQGLPACLDGRRSFPDKKSRVQVFWSVKARCQPRLAAPLLLVKAWVQAASSVSLIYGTSKITSPVVGLMDLDHIELSN